MQTDNEALSKILGPQYGIPKMAARRLEYSAIFLSAFDYEIQHIKAKNNPGDYLSRVGSGSQHNNYKYPEIIERIF